MNHREQLNDLLPQIRDKHVSDRGNVAQTSGINGGKNTSAGISDEVTRPLPLEGTTKADVMRMVEATAMVYRFMEEQHKLDSFLPKQPLILQDVKRLNEFALAICHRFSIPECDSKGRPANIFKMNTSIATLSVQCDDQTTLYMEGTQLEPQCFSCHVDNKNDPVYHYVWVVYKHVPYLASRLWFRVGNVFTFHKSCGDYMKWLTKGCFLKEQQLHLYFDYYCLQRLSLTLDDSHLIEYKEKPLEPIAMLLFFDKVTGCMSSSIDATAQLITHNNWGGKSSEDSRDCHTHWLGAWIC
jgi:hypothetical protein